MTFTRRMFWCFAFTLAAAVLVGGAGCGEEKSPGAQRPFPRKNGSAPACGRCDGTGVDRMTWNHPRPTLCQDCGGSGISARYPAPPAVVQCPVCGGSGWEKSMFPGEVKQCSRCRGTGRR